MTEKDETNHSRQTREAMSALLDGEVSEFEVAKLLKEADATPELRRYWVRQTTYRASLKGLSHRAVDVSAGVRAQLDREEKRSANPLVSMAVAATVTIAVVLVGQQTSQIQNLPSKQLSVPGAVVQLPGTGAVQASFGDSVTPLSGPAQVTQLERRQTRVLESREVYERIAKDRYQKLAPLHATVAADMALNPYIARVPAVSSSSQ